MTTVGDADRPLRVVLSFPDTLGKPGVGANALNQARGLARCGAEVIVCCTSARADVPGAVEVFETLTLGGRRVPHRVLGIDRSYRHHDARVAARLARGSRTRPDIVHTWPSGALTTLDRARALGIPGLREAPNTHTAEAYRRAEAAARDVGMPISGRNSHHFNRRRLAREEREYELATAILAPSAQVAETFRARGFASDRVLEHRYGFDPERFPSPSPPVRSDPSQGLRVVFIGRCEPRKGLHTGLRAWIDSGAAERGRFRIYGSFEPGYREAIADLLGHPSVEVMGFVDDPGAVLRESDLLVLPSVEEGSALVTYEAQASGCALLVSDATGAVAEHMESGLIHRAGDEAMLAEQIRLVDADRALLLELRAHALAQRDHLTWDAAARRLLEVYRQVLARPDPGSGPGRS